jgi:hypothetical protein
MFFHFSKRVLEIEIFCWGRYVVWDVLLGCYFFPFFKKSFGDRNILFVKLFYVVWDVLFGCYFSPFFKKSFGDKNILFVKLFYVVWDLLLLVVLFLFLKGTFGERISDLSHF